MIKFFETECVLEKPMNRLPCRTADGAAYRVLHVAKIPSYSLPPSVQKYFVFPSHSGQYTGSQAHVLYLTRISRQAIKVRTCCTIIRTELLRLSCSTAEFTQAG